MTLRRPRFTTPTALARLATALFAGGVVAGVFLAIPPCPTLVVAASVEKADLLKAIAADFDRGRSLAAPCGNVQILRKASGEAETALARGWNDAVDGPRPDVWSPAATTWLLLLERHRTVGSRPNILSASRPSIAQSPLVIAMPKPLADAMGAKEQIGWREILDLAQDPRGWARYGHPEWGAFRLGKTNPTVSTSGLHALLATYYAAGGFGAIDDQRVRSIVRSVESSVVHYSDTVSTFLENLIAADDRGEAPTYVSAIAMEEKQVWDYNRGNPTFAATPTRVLPRVPLVPIYPREGTLVADHPYVVLTESWVDDAKRHLAGEFLAYLQSDPVQRLFLDAAMRGYQGATGREISAANGLDPNGGAVQIRLPDPQTLVHIQDSWGGLRKRARLLVVLDTSASMGERAALLARPKLDLAKEAAAFALDELVADDQVGLWSFSSASAGSPPYREVVPLAALGDQKARLKQEISALAPSGGGGKGLYVTIDAAAAAMKERIDRARINAVIVLTDGRNDDPDHNDLNGLARRLLTQPEDDRVRVFTVAYGTGADRAALDAIARASRGGSYAAPDPAAMTKVLADVLSSF
jgi:Ca-activated chloride channel family protein